MEFIMIDPNEPPTVPSVDDIVHTPGPWRQFAPRIDDQVDSFYRTITAGSGIRGVGGFDITGFVSEQDAKLMAAAPDMFRVIQRLAEPGFIGETELKMLIRECRRIVELQRFKPPPFRRPTLEEFEDAMIDSIDQMTKEEIEEELREAEIDMAPAIAKLREMIETKKAKHET
jgi:lipoate-protein ligase A